MTFTEQFTLRLKQIRESKRLSKREFAAQIGLSPAFYGEVERGEKFPSGKMLDMINKELNIITIN